MLVKAGEVGNGEGVLVTIAEAVKAGLGAGVRSGVAGALHVAAALGI